MMMLLQLSLFSHVMLDNQLEERVETYKSAHKLDI